MESSISYSENKVQRWREIGAEDLFQKPLLRGIILLYQRTCEMGRWDCQLKLLSQQILHHVFSHGNLKRELKRFYCDAKHSFRRCWRLVPHSSHPCLLLLKGVSQQCIFRDLNTHVHLLKKKERKKSRKSPQNQPPQAGRLNGAHKAHRIQNWAEQNPAVFIKKCSLVRLKKTHHQPNWYTGVLMQTPTHIHIASSFSFLMSSARPVEKPQCLWPQVESILVFWLRFFVVCVPLSKQATVCREAGRGQTHSQI